MPVSSTWGPWHLSECLVTLSEELEKKFPHITIWSIGDAHHKPPSDHLPNSADRVNAIDIPIDSHFTDADCQWLISVLTKDNRVKYIIRNRRIWKPSTGWKAYTGVDPHTGHIHVSVVDSSHNVTRPWIKEGREIVFANVQGYLPTLLIGDADPIAPNTPHLVTRMQIMLDYLVPEKVAADGEYGKKTADALEHVFGAGHGASVTIPMWAQLYGILPTAPKK